MVPGAASAENVPLISVVIAAYNSEQTIDACLKKLTESNYPRFEVIVVDDHSSDRSVEIVRRFPCRCIESGCNRGAAAARNEGVRASSGDILFFLDSDVLVKPTTLSEVVGTFARQPEISALFCSYQKDTVPSNFWSRYKNLVHHYTHQSSREEAATFCGGFGAIRRDVFLEMEGFNPTYRCLEDIELGYRMHKAGHRIFLNKAIQLTHCKRYTLASLIRSDLFHRAIPWTRIMLEKRIAKNDLNTRIHNVLSIPVAGAILLLTPASLVYSSLCWSVAALVSFFVLLNYKFLRFVCREKGMTFALKATAMSWATYLISGFGLLAGLAGHIKDLRSGSSLCQGERLD